MKYTKKYLIPAIGAVTATALFAGTVYADQIQTGRQHSRGECNFANRAAVEQAITNNDYAAWKIAMGDNPITEKITADNFSKLVKMYNLMDEAKQIREELGLNAGPGGKMMGRFRRTDAARQNQN